MNRVIIFLICCFICSLVILFVRNRNKKRSMNEQLRIWQDEHKRWMKEYKARCIIGGKEKDESGIETLSAYKCKKCGYTVRSNPQGFFKLPSGVYYNFKCEKCKNIISVCSKDISDMSFVQKCPVCEESNCFSFWNPIEGHCPKCDGMMEEIPALFANN